MSTIKTWRRISERILFTIKAIVRVCVSGKGRVKDGRQGIKGGWLGAARCFLATPNLRNGLKIVLYQLGNEVNPVLRAVCVCMYVLGQLLPPFLLTLLFCSTLHQSSRCQCKVKRLRFYTLGRFFFLGLDALSWDSNSLITVQYSEGLLL